MVAACQHWYIVHGNITSYAYILKSCLYARTVYPSILPHCGSGFVDGLPGKLGNVQLQGLEIRFCCGSEPDQI